jgi:hypothetical protein
MFRVTRGREAGASAVEAAIVTPVVFLMLFGIIEMGMLFKDYLSVGTMTRNGVRTASAMPRDADYATQTIKSIVNAGSAMPFANVEELWIYRANDTNNFPQGQSSWVCSTKCLRYQWSSSTNAFVKVSGTWVAQDQNACSRALGRPDDRIGVYVRAKHEAFSGIVPTVWLSESSALYLEPFPSSDLAGCVGTP